MKKIDVYKIASLAKLELSADEANRFEAEMLQFAQYAHSLEQSREKSFFSASQAPERTRADEVIGSGTDISKFAPEVTEDGYICVPLTVEAE